MNRAPTTLTRAAFFEALVSEGRRLQGVPDPGNLCVHHGKPVKEWLALQTDPIEVFDLPSTSPEERLNADLKQVMRKKGRCAPRQGCRPRPRRTRTSSFATPSVSEPNSKISMSAMQLETACGPDQE